MTLQQVRKRNGEFDNGRAELHDTHRVGRQPTLSGLIKILNGQNSKK